MSTLTNEYMLCCLVDYHTTTNTIPKYTLTPQQLGVSPSTIRRRFGTWNNALVAANIPLAIVRDQIEYLCDQCGAPHTTNFSSYKRSQHHFCSQSCAAIFNNTGKTKSASCKDKIATTLKNKPRSRSSQRPTLYQLVCEECQTMFEATNKKRKLCSAGCKSTRSSRLASAWLSANRSHIKGSHVQSYMERSFEEWLQLHGLTAGISGYLTEVHFYNPDTKKNGWADFVFPRLRIIIELDGSHHLRRKELDYIRDEYLRDRNWRVFRITHKEYQSKSKLPQVMELLQLS